MTKFYRFHRPPDVSCATPRPSEVDAADTGAGPEFMVRQRVIWRRRYLAAGGFDEGLPAAIRPVDIASRRF